VVGEIIVVDFAVVESLNYHVVVRKDAEHQHIPSR